MCRPQSAGVAGPSRHYTVHLLKLSCLGKPTFLGHEEADHCSLEGPGWCLQEACATNFEYFASNYALAGLNAVGTYFYPTAEALPFRDDFAGNGEHPISDPTGAGEQLILCTASAVNLQVSSAESMHC